MNLIMDMKGVLSCLLYTSSFAVTDVPNQLIARIAADSKYWLWINDQLVVFEGGLKRGPSPSGTYYDPVDIAPYLTKGLNTIAILLWHFGKDGFSHINSGKAALLFEAIAPGLEIVSDASWQCALYEACLLYTSRCVYETVPQDGNDRDRDRVVDHCDRQFRAE